MIPKHANSSISMLLVFLVWSWFAKVGTPREMVEQMNMYTAYIDYEIHESWAPQAPSIDIASIIYLHDMKGQKHSKLANKRRNMGKGIPMEHLGPLYTWPIKFIWPNKKTKTTCLMGANFLESLHEGDLWRSIPNMSQLTVGILGSTNSHTSRGVKNYPLIPEYNIGYRILYNM